MRPFLSYISAIYPDPWSEALSTGKGRMVILGTSWDQAGDCGEYCRDIVAMTSFGKKNLHNSETPHTNPPLFSPTLPHLRFCCCLIL